MSDKILIVDEDNIPVGSADRHKAHSSGKIHRIVRLFLFNTKGELFLQQRSMTVDNYPGLWDQSAAGHVDEGESNEDALRREALEEIGIHLSNIKEVGTYYSENSRTMDGKNMRRFNTLYTAISDKEVAIDHDEVMAGRWVSLQEIDQLIAQHPEKYTNGMKRALDFYRKI